jgi:hypothetical protein
LAPTVEFDAKVRPDFWSVTRIGSSPMFVTRDDLSSQSASQQAGLFGSTTSGGVKRQIGPEFIVMMRPVCGLNPMLNSPWLPFSAVVPEGA